MNRPSKTPLTAAVVTSLLCAGLLAAPAAAQPPTEPPTPAAGSWTVQAPPVSGVERLSAEVALDENGAPTLSVSAGDRVVLPPSPIGIVTDGADLSTGLRLIDRAERSVTESYTMTTGKNTQRHAVMREATLSFAGAGDAELDLVVRVAPDGVAYRYELPDRDGTTVVTGETSSWQLPNDAPAWLLPYTSWYEEPRAQTTAGAAATGSYGHPALFDVGGMYVLLTESGLSSAYPGAYLDTTAGTGRYAIGLVEEQVVADGELDTPWRTAIVGDLATVTESTLVDDLAPPSQVEDTSWIRPGRVAWSWLPEHSSPRDFERQKDYVDYAAAHGWPYTLVDEGWSDAWVPELVRYARAKGVEILLWYRWTDVDTQEEMDAEFSRIAVWGVKGVKLDFMNTGAPTHGESAARHAWYEQVLRETAEHRLLVNFHGSTIPKGLQRTWPHLMSYEAVRGAEYYSFAGDPRVTPSYNTMLPFTRNVAGSMDYTPMTFGQTSRSSSDGHELGLSVAFETGLLHLAEMPEVLATRPEAERYLDQVPTVWDETSLVSGAPGDHAVIARRAGERWFVGGIVGGAGREVEVPLDFTGGGRWLVETVTDDGSGGLVRTATTLTARQTLTVPVVENGGFAAVLCRATDGRTTCDEPVHTVPASTLVIEPGEAVVRPGDSVTVSATFTLDEGDPVRRVTMTPVPPAGWVADGDPQRRPRLAAGEPLTGTWTFTAAEDTASGFVDLPVVVEFDQNPATTRRRVHVEQAVRALVPPPAPSGVVPVSDLAFIAETNGWGPVERDASNGEADGGDGAPLTIGGTQYASGLGVHAVSGITIYLGGACDRFTAQVGVDDEVGDQGTVTFNVSGDGDDLAGTDVITGSAGATAMDVDVSGVELLTLEVGDGGDGINFDHADWADATLGCT
ncbi:glycoside hydrolase family 97 catalytic domain-containing protein [Jiangella asiatica]|uniref:Carbohydrate-binding protein n=1 Tax=Jiangella asiatica TaxID=2530372 RepID=A0A4R5DE86_9ACTN|nr:glycoside hydrolase family 97 catalytic domain-containing protein [Jiangella asiatica]TDE08905.1 carbohydrate-binding protein [Jiangella asiatica]